MNYTPDTGWFYISLQKRSAAWTSVEYLHKFLVNNKSTGPYGRELPLQYAEVGDIVQLNFDGTQYSHSLVIIHTGFSPSPSNVIVASHSYDSFNRALDSYFYQELRLVHIDGVKEA